MDEIELKAANLRMTVDQYSKLLEVQSSMWNAGLRVPMEAFEELIVWQHREKIQIADI